MQGNRIAPGLLTLYCVVSALDITAVFAGWAGLEAVVKPLLMPVLLAYFLAALNGLEHPLATWVKRALIFSWIGDVFLLGSGEVFFGLGLLAFLAAQISYIRGFVPYATDGRLAGRPWLALPYVAAGLVLVGLLAADLGVLLVPVIVYATALVAMAVLANGVSPLTGAGGALFLISDSLIALTSLSDLLPDSAAMLIMPTYLVGQLLIVQGVLQLLGRRALRRTALA